MMPGGFLFVLLGRTTHRKTTINDSSGQQKPERAGATPPEHESALRIRSSSINGHSRLVEAAQAPLPESAGATLPVRRARFACDVDVPPTTEVSALKGTASSSIQPRSSLVNRNSPSAGRGDAGASLPRRRGRHVSFSVPERPAAPEMRHRRPPSGTELQINRHGKAKVQTFPSGRRHSLLSPQRPQLYVSEDRGPTKVYKGNDRPGDGRGARGLPLALEPVRKEDGRLALKLRNDGFTITQAQAPARMVAGSSDAKAAAKAATLERRTGKEEHLARNALHLGNEAAAAGGHDFRSSGARHAAAKPRNKLHDASQRPPRREHERRDAQRKCPEDLGRDGKDTDQSLRKRRESHRFLQSRDAGAKGRLRLDGPKGGPRSGCLSPEFYELVSA
ncbi:hypothetical protein ACQY0O_001956 [Thecaphora frezii]